MEARIFQMPVDWNGKEVKLRRRVREYEGAKAAGGARRCMREMLASTAAIQQPDQTLKSLKYQHLQAGILSLLTHCASACMGPAQGGEACAW